MPARRKKIGQPASLVDLSIGAGTVTLTLAVQGRP
jgi:hypothetical protein